MNSGTIVIVGSDRSDAERYRARLTAAGYRAQVADAVENAAELAASGGASVVLFDLPVDTHRGLDEVQALSSAAPSTRVIVLAPNAAADHAVMAMRRGARDFLLKPVDDAALLSAITNACAHDRPAGSDGRPATPRCRMIGTSAAITDVHAKVRAAAQSRAAVFLTGESGTGKGYWAETVHALSPGADKPFVRINCGGTRSPRNCAEHSREVLETLAQGGTLFLEDLCELDAEGQGGLLHLVQALEQPTADGPIDDHMTSRIISATGDDPVAALRAGQLRADLFYRLHVVPIHLPPLRDRGEDIITIAEFTLQRYAAREGRTFTGLSDEVKAAFRAHQWPGNVRQLQNTLWNIVVLGQGPVVNVGDLPRGFLDHGLPEAPNGQSTGQALDSFAEMTLAEAERALIERAIAREDGSVPRAARALDVSPSTIYRKLEAWGRPARRRG